MRLRKLKLGIRILLLLTATYVAVSFITEVIFYYIVPTKDLKLYPIIGLFYLVTGIIVNYSLIHYRNTSQIKLLNVYMGGRIIKLFLTILFLVLYIYFFNPYKKAFALTMIANYFVFSGLELYIYSLYNKRLINHEKKHKEHH